MADIPPAPGDLRSGLLPNLRYDLPAALVVFLVALPLCLGIALASGAPLLAGILAGIAGGLVVALVSGSEVSVSGPAAGLTVIVASAIATLQRYELFATAVVLAGVLQVVLSRLRAGVLADYVPSSVIKGMMAAIGLVIVLKQIPHALGRDRHYEGDLTFVNPGDGLNTFEEILVGVARMQPVALAIAVLSLVLLVVWERPWVRRLPVLGWVPGPLLVVLLGVGLNAAAQWLPGAPVLHDEHLVALPVATTLGAWLDQLTFPDAGGLTSWPVWRTAATLAIVASLESLLAVEATDRLDPYRRITDKNRELLAQGCGNLVSGLVGGLPVTSVVVRSTANVLSGARSRWSAFFHGVLLLAAAVAVPGLLNRIPLASLAAILILIGYRLGSVALFRQMYAEGWRHFLPFVVTVLAIVFTDLLTGVSIGIVVGVFYVLRTNQRAAFTLVQEEQHYLLRLNKDVTFLNKAELKARLAQIPAGTTLIINGTRAQYVDRDIHEVLSDFGKLAAYRNIRLEYQSFTPLDVAPAGH